jgi:hypothetical protein
MFAIQRNDGKFLCYHNPRTGPSGFRKEDECVNLWMHYYPSVLNRKRDQVRRIYKTRKVKVIRLTPKQLEYFTFVKLRGIR